MADVLSDPLDDELLEIAVCRLAADDGEFAWKVDRHLRAILSELAECRKGLEPFGKAMADMRADYAKRNMPGLTNASDWLERRPDHRPANGCVFTMGDLRLAAKLIGGK